MTPPATRQLPVGSVIVYATNARKRAVLLECARVPSPRRRKGTLEKLVNNQFDKLMKSQTSAQSTDYMYTVGTVQQSHKGRVPPIKVQITLYD